MCVCVKVYVNECIAGMWMGMDTQMGLYLYLGVICVMCRAGGICMSEYGCVCDVDVDE